jgi:hypothetical protein
MTHLCAFCQHHECDYEPGMACNCKVKGNAVEHWFAACRGEFKDRREHTEHRAGGPERRTKRRMLANA